MKECVMNKEQQIALGVEIIEFVKNNLPKAYITHGVDSPKEKLRYIQWANICFNNGFSMQLCEYIKTGNIRFNLCDNTHRWAFTLKNIFLENNTITCRISAPRDSALEIYRNLQQIGKSYLFCSGYSKDAFMKQFFDFLCKIIEALGGFLQKSVWDYFDFLPIRDGIKKVSLEAVSEIRKIVHNISTENLNKYKGILEKRDSTLPFNIFKIVSEKYYHENFHSLILAEILRNKTCLYVFLEAMGVSKQNYYSFNVKTEHAINFEDELRFIDILIRGENKNEEKHSVIIESKINKATDRDKQLHSYYEIMKEECNVDKVIYLVPKNGMKPSEKSLCNNEKLKEKLKILVGYKGNGRDLVSCLDNVKLNDDYGFLLKHYIELLKQTGVGDMSYVARKFFNEMCNTGDVEIASKLQYISDIVQDEGFFMARSEHWKKLADEKQTSSFCIEDDGTLSCAYDSKNTKFEWYLFLESEGNLEDTLIGITVWPTKTTLYKKNDLYVESLKSVFNNKQIKYISCEHIRNYDETEFVCCRMDKFPALSGEKDAVDKLFEIDKLMPSIIQDWEILIEKK